MTSMRWIAAVALAAVVVAPTLAYAQARQEFPNARPVWENVTSGAISTRIPGRMVRQGTARFRTAHSEMINRSRNGPTITEIAPAVKPINQLRADMLAIIFRDLNVALQLLGPQFINGSAGTSTGTGTSTSPPTADVSDLLGSISGPQG